MPGPFVLKGYLCEANRESCGLNEFFVRTHCRQHLFEGFYDLSIELCSSASVKFIYCLGCTPCFLIRSVCCHCLVCIHDGYNPCAPRNCFSNQLIGISCSVPSFVMSAYY